jgi:hypothetical protein
MIERQSVGPVRTMPDLGDPGRWVITRDDGQCRQIVHLDPQAPDASEQADWTSSDCLIHAIALAAGIVAIVIWAVFINH